MADLDISALALNGFDNAITLYTKRRDSIRDRDRGDDDVDLVESYNTDIRDIQAIRRIFLSNLSLTAATRLIMHLDTAVREDVLEELRKMGLKDALEMTGEVKFI